MDTDKKIIIPDNVNWEYLKRFKICAQSSNFKDAAKTIGTSWNALSKQIDALEQSLEVELFEHVHQNRTNKLTKQGDYLYHILTNIEFYLQGGLKLSSPSKQQKIWEVKVVSTPGLMSTLLPEVVGDFLKEHQDVELELITSSTPNLIGENEVVIRADFKLQKDIEKKDLLELSMNLYASEEYIATYGEPKKIEDLTTHKMLFNSGNTNWGFLKSSGVHTIPIKSDSIDFLCKMCQKSLGILELPNIYPETRKLVRVLEEENSPKDTISMGYLKSSLMNKGLREFISFLLKYVGDNYE